MSALLPVALYGLKVPAGDVMIPALMDLPATVRSCLTLILTKASKI
jgi:FK506-binding nuclear protein